MKYVVILGDGMADEPMEELEGRTPLMAAKKPEMDALARKGQVGLTCNVPQGMKPGSDTANLSVIGYDPQKYYTGRSPLEALSIGVKMKDSDVAMRCNIVTVSENGGAYRDQVMVDHSSSEISTEDAAVLLRDVAAQLKREGYQFYVGTSYRHCLIWEQGQVVELTPPHDILEQGIGQYLPQDPVLREMQERSYELLKEHPLNQKRKEQGLNPANSLWFWGAGTKPMLDSFEEKYGKKGMMISAVDLLKGIAKGAGMGVAQVEGANGGLHTNYEGKAQAAVDALLKEGYDFAYIHVEAPDEMGHQGSLERKIEAIQYLDARVVKPVREQLDESGEPYRLLILPDHPTPIHKRTHTADPVPYLLYDSTRAVEGPDSYSEKTAEASGIYEPHGHLLLGKLFA
ncbi:MAG TPA: cofactor-independent phosphoglycerate mutase [Candidatus Egerieimonas intestinavium]|uniref:Cofactor-independent phosphoglycerate mutase n=1 Tax=Candidatus Egerieimonas intestinavium TaxID=2840777 RepID=A0A9D1EJ86_9FIRM|nr:cofactor-independent phosphoglycerate mutase [Candidatus Egerieimonas intestinavium]